MHAKGPKVRGHRYYKHHTEKYGDPGQFGYEKFVPMFTAADGLGSAE